MLTQYLGCFPHWYHILYNLEELLSLFRISAAVSSENSADLDVGIDACVNEENQSTGIRNRIFSSSINKSSAIQHLA